MKGIPTNPEVLIDALDELQERLATDAKSIAIDSDHIFNIVNVSYLILRQMHATCPSVLIEIYNQAVSIQRAAETYARRLSGGGK